MALTSSSNRPQSTLRRKRRAARKRRAILSATVCKATLIRPIGGSQTDSRKNADSKHFLRHRAVSRINSGFFKLCALISTGPSASENPPLNQISPMTARKSRSVNSTPTSAIFLNMLPNLTDNIHLIPKGRIAHALIRDLSNFSEFLF